MAHAVAFDTHDFVKRLTSAGLAVEVAEVFAKEQSLLMGTIVSKDDLKEHKAANKSDAEHLEERIDSKFDLLRYEMEQNFSDVRREIADLRKDMVAMEQRFDAKLDKIGLQIVNKLGGLIVAGIVVIAALPVITKFLHLT
jgi:hypothetical protein